MSNGFVNMFVVVFTILCLAALTYGEHKRVKQHAYRLWQFEAIKAKMAMEALTKISTDPNCNYTARMYAHNVLNQLHKQMELVSD